MPSPTRELPIRAALLNRADGGVPTRGRGRSRRAAASIGDQIAAPPVASAATPAAPPLAQVPAGPVDVGSLASLMQAAGALYATPGATPEAHVFADVTDGVVTGLELRLEAPAS